MAAKAVNDNIGPEGLCQTLLVFGALSRSGRNNPSETQMQRAAAIEKGMKEVQVEHARRRVSFGMKCAGAPVGKELRTCRISRLDRMLWFIEMRRRDGKTHPNSST